MTIARQNSRFREATRSGGALVIGDGVVYETETTDLFARMLTRPVRSRRILINSLIKSLKTANVWSKLDTLYVIAAHHAQAARLNWIGPVYDLVTVNTPTFTVDRGYQGNASSSYVNTGFTPSTANGKYTLNAASFGLWSLTAAPAPAGQMDMGTEAVNRADIRCAKAEGDAIAAANALTQFSVASLDGSGFFSVSRTAADATTLRRNQVQLTSSAIAAVALPAAPFLLGARDAAAFGARQNAAAFIGGALSIGEQDALYSALLAYLQAVGATV